MAEVWNKIQKEKASTAVEEEENVGKLESKLNDLQAHYSKLESEYTECQANLRVTEKTVDKKDRDLTFARLEMSNLEKRLEEIDEAYEICENKLKDTLDKLAECNRRRTNEFGRFEDMLKKHGDSSSDKVDRLDKIEKQIKQLSKETEEAEMKIEETIQLISRLEESHEIKQTKASSCEMRLLKLEKQMQTVTRKFKTLEISAEKSRGKELEYKRMVINLKNLIKKTNARAVEDENRVHSLLSKIDEITVELKTIKENLHEASKY